MRRLLGSVLLALALLLVAGGCGEDDAGSVTDEPAPSPSQTSDTAQPGEGDAVEFELVRAITETGAGGQVSEVAVSLSDDQAVAEFVSQFTNDTLATEVNDVVQETNIPEGMLLYGAVVAVGCDAPGDVLVTTGDSGLTITAPKPEKPTPECFAAMTTVAVVLVPADAVG